MGKFPAAIIVARYVHLFFWLMRNRELTLFTCLDMALAWMLQTRIGISLRLPPMTLPSRMAAGYNLGLWGPVSMTLSSLWMTH